MGKGFLEKESIEAEVLCVGGGIAGLMAAIRARGFGADVVVVEKGNSLRSGNAATGIDHIRCYMPEVHGDIDALVQDLQRSQMGGLRPKKFLRAWMENSFDIVKLWETWGLPMRFEGKYVFQGHSLPGKPAMTLHFSGRDLKRVLTEVALKSGVKIMNRVMIHELLGDDSISGALGVGTREEKLYEFKAKSVVLCTGPCTRLYPGPTIGWMFNLRMSPGCTGDGRAMAYRSGAELVNVELPNRRCGLKYFALAGKGTWAGVLRDPSGKPVGPFITKPNASTGEPVMEYFQNIFREYAQAGKGPLYMDCRGISQEDYHYMMHFLGNEGNMGLINHLEEEGIDLRKNPVEFMSYNDFYLKGGIHYNERGETSLRGLYAAGDEFGGGGSAAAIFGHIAGERAAAYAKRVEFSDDDINKDTIESRERLIHEILNRDRDAGAGWKEVNLALQQIMDDCAGAIRSEPLLDAGLTYLGRLKQKARATLVAENQHELMRCLEVLNLLDVGEIVCHAAKERKETRGLHVRSDYPLTNPILQKLLIIKKVEENPFVEWREVQM